MAQATASERRLALERTAAVAPALGAACMVLLGNRNRTWVRRRSETVSFEASESMRIATTLDVVVPVDLQERVTVGGDRMVLPLDVLNKGALVNFDLTAQGKPASLLQSREVAAVTAWMLAWLALDAGETEIGPAERELLADVCDADVEAADRAFGELEERLGTTHPRMVAEAKHYRDRYILLVEMPVEPQLIVKYARDERLRLRPRCDQQSGLDATPLLVDLPSVAFGASYHVEAVVPGELRIVVARLTDQDGRDLCPPQEMRDRVSMYARGPVHGASARLALFVRTQKDVFLLPAAVIAVLSAVALASVGVLELAGVVGSSVTGSAAGVAFLAPSLAGGLVLQRQPAPIVRVMLSMARLALVVVIVTTVAAAAAMAFGLRDAELGWTWIGLAVVTMTVAGILCEAAGRAPGDVPRRRLPPRQASQ
ncbi:MAG: hypothetical protein HOQ03_11695 [Thermoleophilia bacterium]|nr:hypothetical protein [Thermoleophilia bacterium]